MGTKLPFCIHVPATCVYLRSVSAEGHGWRVMKYQLINLINGDPILMNGKPLIYNNKKDATAGAIGAAMWFGVPVSIREI